MYEVELLKKQLLFENKIEGEYSGKCMGFLLEAGDTLTIQRTPPGTLRPGDILAFEQNNGLYAHRIIYRTCLSRNGTMRTKGDMALGFDKPVSESMVIGRVIRIEKKWGFLDLTSPSGKMVSYLTGVYSYLVYLIARLAVGTFVFMLGGLSLSRRVVDIAARMKPVRLALPAISVINKALHRLFQCGFLAFHRAEPCIYMVFELPVKFLMIFTTYYFCGRTDREIKLSTLKNYDKMTTVEGQVMWIEKGLNEVERYMANKYLLSGKTGANVLVLGCGAGRESFALAKEGFSVTGLDNSPNMIKRASELALRYNNLPGKAEFRVMDLEKLLPGISPESFDYAVMFDTIMFFRRENRMNLFKQIRNTVRPGGKLLLWDYHESRYFFYLLLKKYGIFLPKTFVLPVDFFARAFVDTAGHLAGRGVRDRSIGNIIVHQYTHSELKKEIEAAGWKTVEIGSKRIFPLVDDIKEKVRMDYCVAVRPVDYE
ncbi:MAG: class I SAM-dependent methyltransferase [Elusimicrobia bacterium]|nr:class I SAM-dependent methyltransferase [Elusimicrobiota bacterium]